MKVVFVVHSVVSCWNNGNAHFLRGVVGALQARGCEVTILEPADGWSRANLVADAGEAALTDIDAAFPNLRLSFFRSTQDALEQLDAAEPDLVVAHEWNPPDLISAIGRRRAQGARFRLLFHDTHHRAISRPEEIGRFDLSGYDGVLTFGACLAAIYEARGWGRRVWTWHEAADTRLFRPLPHRAPRADLVWIGNWGDDERGEELERYLLDPVAALGLSATVHGVRYPPQALAALEQRQIRFGGWLPNHRAPDVFARHRVTVHVPRRPYVEALPGIPTIRVFEALACGIPLVSAPWSDTEALFPPGAFLMAQDGPAMTAALRDVLSDPDLAESLRSTGLAAIAARHTCDHRAKELLAIAGALADRPAVRETA